jgi:hypothetical protein
MLATFFRFGFAIFLMAFMGASCRFPAPKPIETDAPDFQYWAARLKPGDVIFRWGYGAVSDWINARQASNLNVSHAGIVVNYNGNWLILHSISGMLDAQDGVQSSTLNRFLLEARPGTVFILRPSLQKMDIKLAIEKALTCWKNNVRFDHDFNPADSTTLYCSEFVLHCFNHGGPAWYSAKPDLDFKILTQADCGELIGPRLPWKETNAQ